MRPTRLATARSGPFVPFGLEAEVYRQLRASREVVDLPPSRASTVAQPPGPRLGSAPGCSRKKHALPGRERDQLRAEVRGQRQRHVGVAELLALLLERSPHVRRPSDRAPERPASSPLGIIVGPVPVLNPFQPRVLPGAVPRHRTGIYSPAGPTVRTAQRARVRIGTSALASPVSLTGFLGDWACWAVPSGTRTVAIAMAVRWFVPRPETAERSTHHYPGQQKEADGDTDDDDSRSTWGSPPAQRQASPTG